MFDSFERLNLLDGWIRNDLIGALPATVATLPVGRRGPNVAWRTAPGWRRLLGELAVGPLRPGDVDRLLAAQGIRGDDATRIRAFAVDIRWPSWSPARPWPADPGCPSGPVHPRRWSRSCSP